MKRTIIAVAACGAALLAAACTPQDAPVNPAASSASGADATTAAESSRAAESTSEETGSSTSESMTESEADESPSAPPESTSTNAATRDMARDPSATRRRDGRARIGDPCPGLEGTLRPAVNGENLVCAGGPVPRWTVILDEPVPTEPTNPTEQPSDPTEEPSPTGEPGGNGNGGSNGNGNGAGNGNGHGPRGHGNAGAPWATPDPAAPAR